MTFRNFLKNSVASVFRSFRNFSKRFCRVRILPKILQEIFGADYEKITNSIVQELTSFNYDDKVMRFIETVSC